MSTPTGATGLLAGAISYALGACALIGPGDLELPTPCPDWNLGMLLAHLGDSMADLETAIRTGCLDPGHPPGPGRRRPGRGTPRPGGSVAVRGLRLRGPGALRDDRRPADAGWLVACTGAVEIAVHGWDVSAARTRAGRYPGPPIPAALATRMLRICPLLVAGREGLFAVPVEVPAQASRVTGWSATSGGIRRSGSYWRVILAG